VAAERGLTPYVGRRHEFDLLHRNLERVKDGRGQVILISGEAGIGKSRLLLEFRRSVQDAVTWLEGQCLSYGKNIPYRPIIDIVKSAFGIEEGDSEAHIIQLIAERTAGWGQATLKTVPYLKALLSLDPGDPAILVMDPRERRAGILDGLRALLLQKSQRRPLVMIVEDLHWIDEQSEAVLKMIVEAITVAKVLLILTYRPGYVHSLGERSYFDRLALADLPPDQRLLLARNVLRQAALPKELATLITGKGEGNPFYIEEVTKSLVEAGVLRKRDGNYFLAQPAERVRVPDTIEEVILSRIDRLDVDAKSALQLASVIGREFTARLLDRISDMEVALDEVLGELKALELIYQEAYFPELAYMFKHALTQDVAYRTLLRERRKTLHQLIGKAIEELYADRLSEQYEMLAHHYYEGELWEEALIYLVKAGDKVAAAYANHDALDYYARALEVCELLEASELKTIADVAQKRGMVNLNIGDYKAAINDFSQMQAVAYRLEDQRLGGMALAFRALAEFEEHDPTASENSLRAALALVGEKHEDIRYFVSMRLTFTLKAYNRHAKANAVYAAAKKLTPASDDPAIHIWSRLVQPAILNWEGRFDDALVIHRLYNEEAGTSSGNISLSWFKSLALGGKGEYQQALDLIKRSLASSERIGENLIRIRLLNTLGWIYGELQAHQKAMVWNRKGIKAAQAVGFPDPEVESNARLNLADNLSALGRLEEAEEQFLIIEQIIRNPRPQDHFMLWRYSQRHFHSYGELWLARGEADKALAYADECLALAEESDSHKNVVKGLRLRGQAFLTKGQLEEAERELSLALEVAQQIGNPTQLWKTRAALGDLYKAWGRSSEAANAYQEAKTIIHEIAENLSDQVLQETFLASAFIQAIISRGL
jgi:tetratricopeptide (TPR) repeat protein